MESKYPLGNRITKDNYQNLRSLALKLTGNDFEMATGFKRGVHNRLRRFSTFEEYKKNEDERKIKYGSHTKKGSITREQIYNKLVEIEESIKNEKPSQIISQQTHNDIQELFIIENTNKDAYGVGYLSKNNKFVVCLGSKARVQQAQSLQEGTKKSLKEMTNKGVLKMMVNGRSYIFTRNCEFESPSGAAGVIMGRSTNGWDEWKNIEGKSLDEVTRKRQH